VSERGAARRGQSASLHAEPFVEDRRGEEKIVECTGVYGSVRELTGAYSTDLDVFREDGVFDQITQQRGPDRIERSPFALVFVSERGGVVAGEPCGCAGVCGHG